MFGGVVGCGGARCCLVGCGGVLYEVVVLGSVGW